MRDMMHRRLFLQLGACAGGSLAVAGAWSTPAGGVEPVPLAGSLAAWLLLHPEQGAALRLAHFDPAGRLAGHADRVWLPAAHLADGASAWGMAIAGGRHAQRRAVAVAARSWGVTPDTCQVGIGHILHPPSGRRIGYRAWVDIA